MSKVRFGILLSLLALAAIACPPVLGDGPPAGTVSAHGSADVKRSPEVLRVQVDILAKGKTIKEALVKLSERRQAAQKNLEAIGFPANAIEFGEPKVVLEKSDRTMRMQQRMMMMQ